MASVRRPHGDGTVAVQSTCSFGHNFTFLLVLSVVMAPKANGEKTRRSQMDPRPESEKF